MGSVVSYRHVIKREHSCFVVIEEALTIDGLLAALNDMVRHGMPRNSLVEFNRRTDGSVKLTGSSIVETPGMKALI